MRLPAAKHPVPFPIKLRNWMRGLRLTPLHPQFLAYRHERMRYRLAADICSGRVLDVGSGRQPLREQLNGRCEYVALDHPQTGALYAARPALYADATRLPFRENVFDTVVCLEAIEHLRNPEEALREARRVLKPGGILIVSAPFLYPVHDAPADFRRWTRHGFELLAESAGLRIESLHVFGNPFESGVLLANLGVAWQALRMPVAGRLPFLLPATVMIPLFNILGFIFSPLMRHMDSTPFAIGYMSILKISQEV